MNQATKITKCSTDQIAQCQKVHDKIELALEAVHELEEIIYDEEYPISRTLRDELKMMNSLAINSLNDIDNDFSWIYSTRPLVDLRRDTIARNNIINSLKEDGTG